MDNTKLPAYPLPITVGPVGSLHDTNDYHIGNGGFTKLELASLMIAQGLVAKYDLKEPNDQKIIAQLSCELAEEILKNANA